MMLPVCWRCAVVLTNGPDGTPALQAPFDAEGNGPYCEWCWLEYGIWLEPVDEDARPAGVGR